MKTIYARKYGDTKRIGLRYARRRNQPQIPQIVVFFEAFVICVRVFTFIRAKRVSNCCIQTKNLRECSSNVGVSEVRIMYQIRMYLVSAGINLYVRTLCSRSVCTWYQPAEIYTYVRYVPPVAARPTTVTSISCRSL